ncbi:MAG TPA: response regulator transcription factor [Sphingomonas sp.]
MEPKCVLVADDHPMFREALKFALARVAPDATVLEAGQLSDAGEAARTAARLDLILLDLRMPGAEGCTGIALLHAERPETPILVISSAEGEEVRARARSYGAIGFLPKTASLDILEGAIGDALAGRFAAPQPAAGGDVADMAARVATLTPTEMRVLLGVLAGRLNKQIAFDLQIGLATVKAHMTMIMRKLDVRSRTQVALAARALDITPPD